MIPLEPIGIIHSPFAEPSRVPRRAADRENVQGTLEVFPAYREGLRDLEGFSHIVVIWRFHRTRVESLVATPPYNVGKKGVFATRSPKRPNSIGLSIVKLERIKGSVLHIRNFEMVEGTPVLDIKPYIPDGIDPNSVRLGWLDAVRAETERVPASGRAAVEVVREYWSRMQANDFRGAAEMFSKDFVLDWPQSNERIRGRANFVAVNEEYPASGRWRFTIDRVVGNDREAVSDVGVTDGVIEARAITFSTLSNGRIARQTEYWPEPYAAPKNRRHLTEPID